MGSCITLYSSERIDREKLSSFEYVLDNINRRRCGPWVPGHIIVKQIRFIDGVPPQDLGIVDITIMTTNGGNCPISTLGFNVRRHDAHTMVPVCNAEMDFDIPVGKVQVTMRDINGKLMDLKCEWEVDLLRTESDGTRMLYLALVISSAYVAYSWYNKD